MKRDDYVRISLPNGDYRYGYIERFEERGSIMVISLYDEGDSKIAFDAEASRIQGDEIPDYIGILTPHEKEVIPLLSRGCSSKEIACEMNIAQATVRAHLRMLRIKCRLDNRAQLCTMAPALQKMIEASNGREASQD